MPTWIIASLALGLLVFVCGGVASWAALDAANIARVGSPDGWLSLLWTLIKQPALILSAPWQFLLRVSIPAAAALVVAAAVGLVTYRNHATATHDGGAKHLRGRRYISDAKEAARLFAREMSPADGLQIHPDLPPLSLIREPEHVFFLGGVGSGKTQTLLPWILAAQARRDSILIHDVKGDFTAGLKNILLVAPWDRRGEVWNVAEDVSTKSAAREFAARVVPENKQSPMWSSAARQVLTGLVINCQLEKPGRWGVADLARGAALPMAELLPIMQRCNPEAIRAIEGQNVTTTGILISMMSFLSPIFDLAVAWPTPPAPGEGFAITRWLAGKGKRTRTIILQSSGQFEQLGRAVNAAIIGLASQIVASPLMPESKTRRLWFFLDEFPQLGRIDPVETLIAVGRSKGVRVVLVAQSLDMLKSVYDAHKAAGWLSMVGNVLIGRTQGETAEFVATRIVGEREVEREQVSVTPGAQQGGIIRSGVGMTYSTSRSTEPVVMPADLAGDLGPDPRAGGVRILWLTGRYALRLLVPFTSLPTLRPASVLSPWTAFPSESRIPSDASLTQQMAAEAGLATAEPLQRDDRDDDEQGEQEVAEQASATKVAPVVVSDDPDKIKIDQTQPLVLPTARDPLDVLSDLSEDKAKNESGELLADAAIHHTAAPSLAELDAALGLADGATGGVVSAVKLLGDIAEAAKTPAVVETKIIAAPQGGALAKLRAKKQKMAAQQSADEAMEEGPAC
ncbi:type IV secretion system DNA-binding domain-containing protein [Rhodocyclus tenuis]|uniref:Type IV secretion system coupling protein TraD DNA-binding domain-containing protein n=1 Tax=Rhodocyclus tenuis TaxID=1066 RepID=A0A840GBB8_RHOTE|nr:type IV secretion system DNA-binding domain-containing protein [Rhodocyclus tenuis]MBB4247958.1 hypothetical protein [Rhodocyclus tenuis]